MDHLTKFGTCNESRIGDRRGRTPGPTGSSGMVVDPDDFHERGPRMTSQHPTTADEIERKFLVKDFNPCYGSGWGATKMVQMYLMTGDLEVRLRRKEGQSVVMETKTGHGLVRSESKAELDAIGGAAMFDLLVASGEVPLVKKTRWKHPDAEWTVDVYEGQGLCVAEIELNAIDEPLPALPPELVLGEEVTGQREWSNQVLARKPVRLSTGRVLGR